MPILRLAMPVPLRRSFDYLPPASISTQQCLQLAPGTRVLAPFGSRQLVGILLEVANHSEQPDAQLKAAEQILDSESLLSPALLALCRWAARYYHHPIGDALCNALPTLLRKGEPLLRHYRWRLSTEGKGLPSGALKRAPKQAQLLALLQQHDSVDQSQLRAAGIGKAIVQQLIKKGLAEPIQQEASLPPHQQPAQEAPPLNDEQRAAVEQVAASAQSYQCFLLEGITGSGKTEVYLQLIAQCLQRGQQALVLIPEIGLTPQTLARFQARFSAPIAVMHSGLSEQERLLAWQSARSGAAPIVIGTRSAVFAPLAELGLIIVDEEHDSSFKQQDGFRYHARDIAIKRALAASCPVLLGSATPSLESLHNAHAQRYRLLSLRQRATGATLPRCELIDIRASNMQHGLSPMLLSAIDKQLKAGNQALVFINRRGFAAALLCHDCGYIAQCRHCDAKLTVHINSSLLRCHHCNARRPLPRQCPDCQGRRLEFRGSGTERTEMTLQKAFPDTPVLRIDRDTTSGKFAMQAMLDQVNQGQPCILVGTQMLAKGHHFSDVTLVGMIDIDGGLFSADFRSPEYMGQLLTQVAGRAGRAGKPGRVLVQTHQPDHPLLRELVDCGYNEFSRRLLSERHLLGMPPYSYLAMLRIEAKELARAEQVLAQWRQQLQNCGPAIELFGPLPAPMARRAGYSRAQLLLKSGERAALHQGLAHLLHHIEQHPPPAQLRWSLDVDPCDLY